MPSVNRRTRRPLLYHEVSTKVLYFYTKWLALEPNSTIDLTKRMATTPVNNGMQTTTTRNIGYPTHDDGSDTRQRASSFRALFVLSGSKGVSPGVLRKQLGLSDDDFNALLESLQKTYLVDSVSELRGDSIVEYLCLTDEGTSTLQQMMERMCELPELE